MLGSLKTAIQNHLYQKQKTKYEAECLAQENSYLDYVNQQESARLQEMNGVDSKLGVKIVKFSELKEGLKPSDLSQEILLFVSDSGACVSYAVKAIQEYFESHPEEDIVYADEDYRLLGKGAYFYPVSKPCWAPETFLSFNYFGEFFAVRTAIVSDITWLDSEDVELSLYDFLLKITEKTSHIGHMEEVLYHRLIEGTNVEEEERKLRAQDLTPGSGKKFLQIKNMAFTRRKINGQFELKGEILYPVYAITGSPLVSILIPSKDNPDVLKRCIQSIQQNTTEVSYEVIIVDNGSNQENRKTTESVSGGNIHYFYEPADFNFSNMINSAANHALGDWFLLLNDDMEVLQPDWLTVLLGQAMQDGIGAVGAKLCYPYSNLIQHVGVTNAIDGPVHKLMGMEDTTSYYHGRNRLVYDVCAVTGACLLVSKANFEAAGKLDSKLRVAYNDVDLCFSLMEKGLRSVVRNDVRLYHYESLSRGHDSMSAEKLSRLKEERDYLYHKHPSFYYRDPYEGAFNSGGSSFGVRNDYGIGRKKNKELLVKRTGTDYRKYPAGIYINMERVEKEELLRTAEGEFYVISGWMLVPEGDNLRYQYQMVFIGESGNYEMKVKKYYNKNISDGFPKAQNLKLSGFFCYVTEGELPAGSYQIGVFGRDTCSRQKLFQLTDRTLRIE